jgi:hypothetical protein
VVVEIILLAVFLEEELEDIGLLMELLEEVHRLKVV